MNTPKTALISVWDKTGAVELARFLAAAGWRIISTGGTARHLRESGLKVMELSELTGFPEMLSGRVKSLHLAVHAGILARRAAPEDVRQLEESGIKTIDLVAVNLYPFPDQVDRATGIAAALELIDVGGASLLRSAAKNHPDVVVLSDPADYRGVIDEYHSGGGEISSATRRRLAAKVFQVLSAYDRAVAGYLAARGPDEFPVVYELTGRLQQEMRYGENPHQRAALYATAEPLEGASLLNARLLQGKKLSYNNILDLESALALALELGPSAAVIVKHNNPCGAAVSSDLLKSYLNARSTDPVSAFGGVVAVHGPVGENLSQELVSTFLEAVAASLFSPRALKALAAKKNLRLLEIPCFLPRSPTRTIRSVYGGFLVQDDDLLDWKKDGLEVVSRARPTPSQSEDLAFAWRVVKHARSNAIVLARDQRTIGIGVGQMSRIDAARLAVEKARSTGLDIGGAVLASDGFFPFRDVVDLVAAAGVSAIVQPGGSIRDNEVVTAADEKGLAMVFTGIRHFKH